MVKIKIIGILLIALAMFLFGCIQETGQAPGPTTPTILGINANSCNADSLCEIQNGQVKTDLTVGSKTITQELYVGTDNILQVRGGTGEGGNTKIRGRMTIGNGELQVNNPGILEVLKVAGGTVTTKNVDVIGNLIAEREFDARGDALFRGKLLVKNTAPWNPEEPYIENILEATDGGVRLNGTTTIQSPNTFIDGELHVMNDTLKVSNSGVTIVQGTIATPLIGTGNAYVCVKPTGVLYRSEAPCR